MEMSEASSGPWVWYGGRPSVDLVNTRMQRYAQGRELLRQPGDLAAWLAAAGLVTGPVAIDGALLDQARELREAIDAGVRALTAGEAFPAASQGIVNAWLARLAEYPSRLEMRNGVPSFQVHSAPQDARGALCRIALDAAEIFGSEARDRLRICSGTNCSGRFFDNSAGRRRRWCQMAVCGNRAKASQHRSARASGRTSG